MKKRIRLAFSLIELSIVIVVIGILVLGITKGSRMVYEAKLKSARALTAGSPVASISDLSLWLETTLSTSVTNASGSTNVSDGDSISSWNDYNPQSVSKINPAQSTPANRPTYLLNGINGLPTMYFDGNAFYLRSTNGPIPLRDSTYSFVVVLKTMASTSSSWQQVVYQGAYCNGATLGAVASITLNPSGGAAPGLATCMNDYYPVSYKLNASYIDIAVVNGQSVKFYSNSNTATTSTLASTNVGPTTSDLDIANTLGSQFFKGYISEIIVFSKALSTAEVASVNEYLSRKYGIRVN